MNIGVITYDVAHLKTEQVIHRLVQSEYVNEIHLYALPFVPRKPRSPLYPHRPNQALGTHPRNLCAFSKVSFHHWNGNGSIFGMDLFLIGGAGIIDPSFAEGVPVLNAHPGIIPSARGLDAFKWTIYEGIDLGVTLHMIDKEVDKGEILCVEKTPVYIDDTYESLARRHYELEINVLCDFKKYLEPLGDVPVYEELEAHMRMPKRIEKEMMDSFSEYVKEHSL